MNILILSTYSQVDLQSPSNRVCVCVSTTDNTFRNIRVIFNANLLCNFYYCWKSIHPTEHRKSVSSTIKPVYRIFLKLFGFCFSSFMCQLQMDIFLHFQSILFLLFKIAPSVIKPAFIYLKQKELDHDYISHRQKKRKTQNRTEILFFAALLI